MAARDGTGAQGSARSVTSCADCLAWGLTYAQGVCLACYNFAAARFGHARAECAACRAPGAAQARLLPAVLVPGPRGPRHRRTRCRAPGSCSPGSSPRSAATSCSSPTSTGRRLPHQPLRAAGVSRAARSSSPHRSPPVRAPPERSCRCCPICPAATGQRRCDLRSTPAPDNPWLAWALHLAHTTAEARGFDPAVRRSLNRNLVMLLATHVHGDQVRTSDFHRVIRNHGGALVHVIDVLSAMDVLHEDRPPVFDTWLAAKTEDLTPGIAEQTRGWAQLLRHGGPRRLPRHPEHRNGLPQRLSGSKTRPWCLTSGSGCRLVLVDEAAQDRSTPDPAVDRLESRHSGTRRTQL